MTKKTTNTTKFKEELTENQADNFPVIKNFCDSKTYRRDYNKALKFANKKKGFREIYTMVDTETNRTAYLKGLHFVNRFGFCVLGVK